MDWYEEVVLAVEVSPNKQHASERQGGWLIHHCNHETTALSPCHILKKQNQNSNELGEKKPHQTGP